MRDQTSVDPSDESLPAGAAARACEAAGVSKAGRDAVTLVVMGVLAGAFIAFGALFMVIVATEAAALPWGVARLLGGLAFSLGLVLVVVAGAELFTGDALMVVAWASQRITFARLLRAWVLVYLGNVVGALGTAALVLAAGEHELDGGAVGRTLLALASAKAALPTGPLFVRAVLCNVLVCLAVWMSFGARSATDKIMVTVAPVAAFVAAGLEHSIANLFLLPWALGVTAGSGPEFWRAIGADPGVFSALDLQGAVHNVAVATVGNVLGGSLMVGAVYWFLHCRRGAGRGQAT